MIHAGHPPEEVWRYTLRQAWAFLFIAGRERRQELIEDLNIQSVAASGDGEAIKKLRTQLEK